MSEDKLRGFIKEHKSEFETERAPTRVWDRIDDDLNKSSGKRSFSLQQMLLIVAGICMLFVAGIYFGSQYFGTEKQNQMYASIEDQEYQEMQNYYGSILHDKQETFVSHEHENSVLDELSELDKGFEELKSDFINSSANNKEMMMYLMKENYELRIKILEMAMEKMNVQPSIKNKTNYENIQY